MCYSRRQKILFYSSKSDVKDSENFPPCLEFISNPNINKLECNEYQKEMATAIITGFFRLYLSINTGRESN